MTETSILVGEYESQLLLLAHIAGTEYELVTDICSLFFCEDVSENEEFMSALYSLESSYQNELLWGATKIFGEHTMTSGGEIFELVESLVEINEKIGLINRDCVFTDFLDLVYELGEHYKTSALELARYHFGVHNVKTEEELFQMMDKLRLIVRRANGVELPADGEGAEAEEAETA